MHKYLAIYFLALFFSFPAQSNSSFSVMTLNVNNLFDELDDPKKDDKAYLPIELKQTNKHINSCNRVPVNSWKNECLYLDWDTETKDAKLKNLARDILLYDETGPDILALQEVENINILEQLYRLLEPYGYIDLELLESKDYRGIDTAIISKFEIINSTLHYIKFSGEFEDKDTRPILDSTILINDKKIKVYNVHFPAGYHDVSMRIDSLNKLKKLLQMHNMPTVALGDFNVNTEEDSELFIYKDQEDLWDVAHSIGCADCKGTYYYSYGKSWSFLDTIFVSKQRNISYDADSIKLHITEHNAYKDSGKPIRFNAKSKTGVSDHLPMVARIKIN
ncbi:endonuclease/exonuclease/phosphatase family protein [Gammaproteobacteria bacterium]|nr:endonuclease/exonuclease/phosphatase family protein [Gammaproteobacteria bacterium]